MWPRLSLRRSACLVAMAGFTGCSAPAGAGEIPKLSIIGFSPERSTFAYEQFSRTEDGQTWSEITVLDTVTGQPVVGGPFRTIDARGTGTEISVRLMSYAAASPMLSRKVVPGTVAARASGVPGDVTAQSADFDVQGLGRLTLKVRGYAVKAPGCEAMGGTVRALNIKLFDTGGKEIRSILVEKAPPPTRFCPSNYALVEARLLEQGQRPPVLALVVALSQPSNAGLDRRYVGFVADLSHPPPAPEKEDKEAKSEH